MNKLTILIFLLITFSISQLFAVEKQNQLNSISLNILNLITIDPSQYPFGIEVKYSRNIDIVSLELISAINYGIENGNPSILLYLEPRIRSSILVNFDTNNSGLYLSFGLFYGLSSYSNINETILGVDGNVGVQFYINNNLFIDYSIGLQYPDFPLARSFRIHYFINEINYLSIRMNLGLGYSF